MSPWHLLTKKSPTAAQIELEIGQIRTAIVQRCLAAIFPSTVAIYHVPNQEQSCFTANKSWSKAAIQMTQVTLRQLHHLKVAIPAIDPSWIVPTWPTGGNGPMKMVP
jgi:hypothetical protein